MSILIDTNILVRLANTGDQQHNVATSSIVELHRRGEILYITPQVLIEFRNTATRPKSLNGAGLSITEAENHAASFEARFPLLPDVPDIYPRWKTMVGTLAIIGKQVHDARLVAVCHAHAVTHVLTFNVAHFTRMARHGPGIVVVDPATV
jgi:predicted nucleic acid-binding protein